MEDSQRASKMVVLFGDEPRTDAQYRLPFFAIGLIVLTAPLIFLIQERSLGDLIGPALFVYGTLQALGDRVWSRSREAASWLRLAGILAAFAGFGSLALDYYIQQQPVWLTLALMALSIGALWAIADAISRLRSSSRASG